MASLQSKSTFSFKHHLTGEAWPACRAILPFHLNKHHLTGEAFLAWYVYIVRTSTIAKNRYLNIVLQAELYLRTGTYDWPKYTLAINSARALAIDVYPRIALVMTNYRQYGCYTLHPTGRGTLG